VQQQSRCYRELGHFTKNNNKNHISRANNNTCFESNGVRISPVWKKPGKDPNTSSLRVSFCYKGREPDIRRSGHEQQQAQAPDFRIALKYRPDGQGLICQTAGYFGIT
jgi:hypothetical protein